MPVTLLTVTAQQVNPRKYQHRFQALQQFDGRAKQIKAILLTAVNGSASVSTQSDQSAIMTRKASVLVTREMKENNLHVRQRLTSVYQSCTRHSETGWTVPAHAKQQ